MALRMEEGRAGQRCQKCQGGWKQGSGQRIVYFSNAMAMESTMDEVSARKKNSRVSLCFSYLKILKQPFWAI
jgi:hypothetical protein